MRAVDVVTWFTVQAYGEAETDAATDVPYEAPPSVESSMLKWSVLVAPTVQVMFELAPPVRLSPPSGAVMTMPSVSATRWTRTSAGLVKLTSVPNSYASTSPALPSETKLSMSWLLDVEKYSWFDATAATSSPPTGHWATPEAFQRWACMSLSALLSAHATMAPPRPSVTIIESSSTVVDPIATPPAVHCATPEGF